MFKKNYNQCIHNPYNNKIILKHILLGFVCFDTGSHYVALDGLKLRDLPVPASKVLGLTTLGHHTQLHTFSFLKISQRTSTSY